MKSGRFYTVFFSTLIMAAVIVVSVVGMVLHIGGLL